MIEIYRFICRSNRLTFYRSYVYKCVTSQPNSPSRKPDLRYQTPSINSQTSYTCRSRHSYVMISILYRNWLWERTGSRPRYAIAEDGDFAIRERVGADYRSLFARRRRTYIQGGALAAERAILNPRKRASSGTNCRALPRPAAGPTEMKYGWETKART